MLDFVRASHSGCCFSRSNSRALWLTPLHKLTGSSYLGAFLDTSNFDRVVNRIESAESPVVRPTMEHERVRQEAHMPPNVYPDATIDELAAILARGVVRRIEQAGRERHPAHVSDPPESSESRQDCLEVSERTVLSVLTGLRTRDFERTRT